MNRRLFPAGIANEKKVLAGPFDILPYATSPRGTASPVF